MQAAVQQLAATEFPVVNAHCAGIDLGAETHYVGVPQDSCADPVRRFGCFTRDLAQMATWLNELGVTCAVMEATGPYWFQVREILEAHGIHVDVIDPRSAKVPGRKKTDVADCQWLQRMHACGLLSKCFIPTEETSALRTYYRRRQSLIEDISRQSLIMQQSLTLMNVQIHRVLSDVTGVSGMRILREIVRGERDPKMLASLCDIQVKASREDVAKSLEGTWREEHLFCLAQSLSLYDEFHKAMQNLDEQIALEMARLAGSSEKPAHKIGARKNQSRFELSGYLKALLGCDPTQIEGLDTLTVLTLVSELGLDLSAFPDAKHLSSYLMIAPNHKTTGGKVRSRKTRPGVNASSTALRLAAQSLSRSQSYLGAFLRSVAARRGMAKAIVATARKLAERYYLLITKGGEYTVKTVADFEEVHAKKRLDHFKRRAKELGFVLVPGSPDPEVS